MSNDLWEDLLGPDAGAILQQAAQSHQEHATPEELEAVEIYNHDRSRLTERHKAALADLLTAVADDFSSRRRAAMIHEAMLKGPPGGPQEPDELLIPDEDGRTRPRPVKDDGNSLEAFLDDLDSD